MVNRYDVAFLLQAPANTRASRRGNTGGASVIPHAWAYRVSRLSF